MLSRGFSRAAVAVLALVLGVFFVTAAMWVASQATVDGELTPNGVPQPYESFYEG